MTELLPCPFCGGDDHCPDVLEFVGGRSFSEGGEPAAWGYGCSCSAFIGPFSTEAEAIAAWNTRTPNKEGEQP